MFAFFRAGGFSMAIITAVGIALLWTAIRFALRADAQRLALIRALTWAIAFASVTGFVAGLASTAMFVVRHEPPEPLPPLLGGFAESASNLTLGGAIAVVAWILVAVGVRRMPGDPS